MGKVLIGYTWKNPKVRSNPKPHHSWPKSQEY